MATTFLVAETQEHSGKRNVEQDYGTPHSSMLKSETGTPPTEDFYNIALRPKSFDSVRNQDAYRRLVKASFNAMLNSTHRTTSPPREIKLKLWGMKWGQILLAKMFKASPVWVSVNK